LPLFIAPRQLKPFIDKELIDGPLKPIDYLDGDRVIRGYIAHIPKRRLALRNLGHPHSIP